jgi:hypothetical protein
LLRSSSIGARLERLVAHRESQKAVVSSPLLADGLLTRVLCRALAAETSPALMLRDSIVIGFNSIRILTNASGKLRIYDRHYGANTQKRFQNRTTFE